MRSIEHEIDDIEVVRGFGVGVVASDRDHEHIAAPDRHGRMISRLVFSASPGDEDTFAEFVLMRHRRYLRQFQFHPQRKLRVIPEDPVLRLEIVMIRHKGNTNTSFCKLIYICFPAKSSSVIFIFEKIIYYLIKKDIENFFKNVTLTP